MGSSSQSTMLLMLKTDLAGRSLALCPVLRSMPASCGCSPISWSKVDFSDNGGTGGETPYCQGIERSVARETRRPGHLAHDTSPLSWSRLLTDRPAPLPLIQSTTAPLSSTTPKMVSVSQWVVL